MRWPCPIHQILLYEPRKWLNPEERADQMTKTTKDLAVPSSGHTVDKLDIQQDKKL